eukprot:scaffold71312_cov39-Tisochrysis_lutea.AAC.1
MSAPSPEQPESSSEKTISIKRSEVLDTDLKASLFSLHGAESSLLRSSLFQPFPPPGERDSPPHHPPRAGKQRRERRRRVSGKKRGWMGPEAVSGASPRYSEGGTGKPCNDAA